MRCWCGYLSGAKCKWFAYGPADATATPSSLASLCPEWFSLSGTGLLKCPGKKAVKWVCSCVHNKYKKPALSDDNSQLRLVLLGVLHPPNPQLHRIRFQCPWRHYSQRNVNNVITSKLYVLFGHEVFGGSTRPRNAASWRDVIRSNRISQTQQHIRITDLTHRRQFFCLQVNHKYEVAFTARNLDSIMAKIWGTLTINLDKANRSHVSGKRKKSVCGEVQICIWPSWCHCHSLSLAPVNPDWFYLSGTGSPR